MAKENSQHNQVKRSLKTRHLSMIALGGSIGTGLFVASGSTISMAGPGGALIAYLLIGMMVYFLMTSLGEMATFMPVSGSFSVYASKFVDPAAGFALGWNYWFNWAITLAVDLSTAGIVVHFWLPTVPGWLISIFAFLGIFLINIISVKSFAETEYWMSLIKVVTVILFLIVGCYMVFIGFHGHPAIGLRHYEFFPDGRGPIVGGIPAIFGAFVVAGFSFQGTELVGITAGESETPETSIPKAIKQVFFRILIFYIFAIFIIGALIPFTSPKLLGSSVSDIAISPFTLVFQQAGLTYAADLINVVILISVLSAANSGMYAATRMLWSMGGTKFAPVLFSKTNSRGIPVPALLLTSLVGIGVLVLSVFGNNFYGILVTASGLTGFIAWLGIAVSHYRFRRALEIQHYPLDSLKYKAPFFPIGPLLAIAMGILVIVGQDLKMFYHFNLLDFTISYISIPIFLVAYFYYKIKYKSTLVDLSKVDLTK